ncbi:MAG: hypothetical protein K2M93_00240 [Muribaculaceae bacterium]|nr:hypothetical protein [Muribaculaceae bacterium]
MDKNNSSGGFLQGYFDYNRENLRNMINTTISIAKRLEYTKYGLADKSVYDVLGMIQRGDMILYDPECGEYDLKTITEAIRRQPDPEIQNEWKARFMPVVFFNGIWDGSKISKYSCITALDFDNIHSEEDLNNTLLLLKSSPFVLATFRTFKPKRIKALIMHDNPDPTLHKEMYAELINLFGTSGLDTSCSDLSRKTYLPWDDEIWINTNCTPYQFVSSHPVVGTQTKMIYKGKKQKSPYSIINILNSSWRKNHTEYWKEGQRARSVFKCACQFCEYGVPRDMAEDYFLTGGWEADDFTADEILKHVRGAYDYNKNRFGSKDFV